MTILHKNINIEILFSIHVSAIIHFHSAENFFHILGAKFLFNIIIKLSSNYRRIYLLFTKVPSDVRDTHL